MNTSPRASLLAPACGVIVHAALWLALAIGLMTLMPAYEREFAYFQMKLPMATEWAVATYNWLANYWYVLALMFVPLCAIDAAVLFGTWRRPWARGLNIFWLLVMAAAPLALMGMFAVSVWTAHMKLLEGLSR